MQECLINPKQDDMYCKCADWKIAIAGTKYNQLIYKSSAISNTWKIKIEIINSVLYIVGSLSL